MSAERHKVSSEFLKRTCLICGCHTNLTINIYEPRSGPNIVDLIQAKFNFQPLNEDKYLCFSCNNWLINWHSLQAPNSNEAESPSQNNSSNNSSNNTSNNMVHDNASCLPQQNSSMAASERPVATVRPRQLQMLTQEQQIYQPGAITNTTSEFDTSNNNNESERLILSAAYGKRRFRRGFQFKHCINEHKMLRQCRVCGCAIVLRVAANNTSSLNLVRLKRSKNAQCRKCREISNWRALHMRTLSTTLPKRSPVHGTTAGTTIGRRKDLRTTAIVHNNNNSTNVNSSNPDINIDQSNSITQEFLISSSRSSNSNTSSNQRYRQPRVDGKVVAMFRRLGTTLSREPETLTPLTQHQQQQQQQAEQSNQPQTLPAIMSPAKQRPRWSRQLEDDEILLEFDTAISEVLPASSSVLSQSQARRKLSYPITVDASLPHNNQHDNDDEDNIKGNNDVGVEDDDDDVIEIREVEPMASSVVDLQDFKLPQGLSITLL